MGCKNSIQADEPATKEDTRALNSRLIAIEKKIADAFDRSMLLDRQGYDEILLAALQDIKANHKEIVHSAYASSLLSAVIVMLYIKFTSSRPFLQDFVLFGALLVHFLFGIIIPRSASLLGHAEGQETALVAVLSGYMCENMLVTVFNNHGVSFDGTGIVFFIFFIFLGSVRKEIIAFMSVLFISAKLYFHGQILPIAIHKYPTFFPANTQSSDTEQGCGEQFTLPALFLLFAVQIIAFALLVMLYRERRARKD
jgi:hypothetical protein